VIEVNRTFKSFKEVDNVIYLLTERQINIPTSRVVKEVHLSWFSELSAQPMYQLPETQKSIGD